jgi:hypothetical protein
MCTHPCGDGRGRRWSVESRRACLSMPYHGLHRLPPPSLSLRSALRRYWPRAADTDLKSDTQIHVGEHASVSRPRLQSASPSDEHRVCLQRKLKKRTKRGFGGPQAPINGRAGFYRLSGTLGRGSTSNVARRPLDGSAEGWCDYDKREVVVKVGRQLVGQAHQQVGLGGEVQHSLDVAVRELHGLERESLARGALDDALPVAVDESVAGDRQKPRDSRSDDRAGGRSASATSAAANVSAIRSIATSGLRVRLSRNASTRARPRS